MKADFLKAQLTQILEQFNQAAAFGLAENTVKQALLESIDSLNAQIQLLSDADTADSIVFNIEYTSNKRPDGVVEGLDMRPDLPDTTYKIEYTTSHNNETPGLMYEFMTAIRNGEMNGIVTIGDYDDQDALDFDDDPYDHSDRLPTIVNCEWKVVESIKH